MSPTSALTLLVFPPITFRRGTEGPLIERGGEQNRIRILIFQRAICRGISKTRSYFPASLFTFLGVGSKLLKFVTRSVTSSFIFSHAHCFLCRVGDETNARACQTPFLRTSLGMFLSFPRPSVQAMLSDVGTFFPPSSEWKRAPLPPFSTHPSLFLTLSTFPPFFL